MDILSRAREIIDVEIEGLNFISSNLGVGFNQAVNKIISTNGRVICCGMGKSGIIAKKISASLASTGTPSFFLHPAEAFHGDLGMIKPEDIFFAISYSGETSEVLKLLPFLSANKNYLISLTNDSNSSLSKASDCHINIKVPKEACPYQLAPTSSTTGSLVVGDCLAICLMEMRGFKPQDFARFHPGGSLGRRLLRKVCDEVVSVNLPFVDTLDSISYVISTISSGCMGLCIVRSNNQIVGIITDGDLRRAIEKFGHKVFELVANDIASKQPIKVDVNVSIEHAYDIMFSKNISSLLCFDHENFIGILSK